MLDWLFRRKKNVNIQKELIFKDNLSAFKYATVYLAGPLKQDNYLYGYVVNEIDRAQSGVSSLKQTTDMNRHFRVRLATQNGIVEVTNCGAISNDISGRHPESGDLVAVNVARYDPKYAAGYLMNYFLIEFIAQPKLIVESHQFAPLIDQTAIAKSMASRGDGKK